MVTQSESSTSQPTTPLVEVVVTDGLHGRASERLQDILVEAMSLHPARLVVDLTDCATLDAVALDVLLDTHRRMWSLGGRLILRSPSPRLQRILTVARVDHVFHITHGGPPQGLPEHGGTHAPADRETMDRP